MDELGNYSAQIGQALQELNNRIGRLRQSLASATISGHLFNSQTGQPVDDNPASIQLIQAIADISMPATTEPGTSNVNRYPGYFACDSNTVEQIRSINQSKQQLAQISASAKQAGITWRDIRASFAAAGFARCHALQATRVINVVPGDIRAIGFTAARRIKSITHFSLSQALQWLDSAQAWDVIEQIALRDYPAGATVRLLRPVCEHYRANLSFACGSAQQVNASLPIIIDNPYWNGRISFNMPSAKPPQQRSDSRKAADSIPLPFIANGLLEFYLPQNAA